MDAGVDHQPVGPEDLADQGAEAGVGIVVHAQLAAQGFGIQRPPLHIGGVQVEAAEVGQAGLLLGQRNLKVVAGGGLVDEGGLHVVFGPGADVVGVDHEHAGPGPVGRAGPVLRPGGRALQIFRDRLDHEVGLGRAVEQPVDVRLDARADRPVAVQQLVPGLVVEAGVGAQEGEELPQRAVEAGLLLHPRHLGGDAPHLVQADPVNVVRAQGGGGVLAHQEGVQRAAPRHGPQAVFGAGGRQVGVAHEVVQPAIGRDHACLDGLHIGGLKPVPVGLGHALGEVSDRAVEDAVGGPVDQVGGQLRQHPFHDDARLDDAVGQPLAHAGDGQVGVADEAVDARQAGLVLRHRLKRRDGRAGVDLGEEVGQRDHLVDRHARLHQVEVPPAGGRGLFHLIVEQVVAQPVGGPQTGPVDRPQPLGVGRVERAALGDGLVGQRVVQPVQKAVVATEPGGDRAQPERVLLLVGEQFVQGFGMGLGGRRDGRLGGQGRRRRDRHQRQDGQAGRNEARCGNGHLLSFAGLRLASSV